MTRTDSNEPLTRLAKGFPIITLLLNPIPVVSWIVSPRVPSSMSSEVFNRTDDQPVHKLLVIVHKVDYPSNNVLR